MNGQTIGAQFGGAQCSDPSEFLPGERGTYSFSIIVHDQMTQLECSSCHPPHQTGPGGDGAPTRSPSSCPKAKNAVAGQAFGTSCTQQVQVQAPVVGGPVPTELPVL